MPSLPKVCIIGAGSSGIAGAKVLHQRGIPFDCYEKSDRVGGNWVFGNANGMSAAYTTLHINTSRERMEYSDYPMPKTYPDFPHHAQIAEYFESYVGHFGFRDAIRFETGIKHAGLGADGIWTVATDTGETHRYDALIVANGHHWNPRWPEPAFPGSDTFEGVQMHAHEYTDPEAFRDKAVVILGMGNSAMDLAVDASYVGKATYLAARRGAHIVPKYIFGKPMDQLPADPRVPWAIRRRVLEAIVRMAVGKPEDYGLPKPDHRLADAHPTVSGRILDRIAHGTITPKPNIDRLEGRAVVFADGTRVDADVVVYCTGYKITFPFFDEDFIAAPNNDLPLYRRVFHPDIRSVFFLGLLQPLGAVMPLAEAQSHWVSAYLRGEYALPPAAEMRADMAAERERMFKRYVASKRHTIQVDFDDYLLALDKERAAGAERARLAGYPLPIPPRAEAAEGSPVPA
jgi:dimethylaniline monooxygenase (N-oxide forming)